MKKLLITFFAIITLLSGCSTLEKASYFPGEEFLYGVDFKRYSDKGFLVTPEKYTGEYESIGLLTYELIPASHYRMVKRVLNPDYKNIGSDVPRSFDVYKWIDDDINVQMALDSLYNICVENGADALMNLKQSPILRSHDGIENPHTVVGIQLSGFAIKRK